MGGSSQNRGLLFRPSGLIKDLAFLDGASYFSLSGGREKYTAALRFPRARCAGTLLISTEQKRPPLRTVTFLYSVDTLSEIWNQLESYVLRSYELIRNARIPSVLKEVAA